MATTIGRSAALSVLAMSFATPATAQQLIDATRPERILTIARGFGTAELTKDKDGDPRITGRMDGTRYSVIFYGCKEGKACKSIQFHAGFEIRNKPTYETINVYNLNNRFSRAYIDKEGDPIVEMDMNLDGGVSQKNLDDTFDWWKVVLRNFKKAFVD